MRDLFKFVQAAIEGAARPEPEEDGPATEVALDLRPSRAVLEALRPLGEEGFHLNDVSVPNALDTSTRQLTLLHRGNEQHYLVGLRPEVARDEESLGKIAVFDLVLPRGCSVYILSHGCDAMQLPLHRTIEAYGNISAAFVPWLWIQPVGGSPRSAARLMSALGLEPTKKKDLEMIGLSLNGGSADSRELTQEEIRIVSANFAAHLATNGQREFFDDFISRLELTELVQTRARAQWGDGGGYAPARLVAWARSQGPPMITRFLRQLIEEGVGRPDVPALLGILEACGNADDATLDGIREQVRRTHG